MPRIAIIAGEVSGDLLGAGLIQAILKTHPDVKFEGIAGDAMQMAGCETFYPADDLAVMGLTEVIKDLPRLLAIKKAVLKRWIENPPDLFIGIDAPDFNLRVAKELKAAGVHTVHYVSPSVWAWREGRVKSIERAVDNILCLLPFEPKYYKDTSVQADFIGHPMASSIALKSTSDIQSLPSNPLIAVLPGSRSGEINNLAIPFIQTISELAKRYPKAEFSIPVAKPKFKQLLENLLRQHAPGVPVELLNGQADELLAKADLALVASGTAALETMLYGCPMVVAYRMASSTYWLLDVTKSFKTKYFSLPNILAGEELVKEVMQHDMTVDNLFKEVSRLMDDSQRTSDMRHKFIDLHNVLKQDTNSKVAKIVLDLLVK